MLSLCSLDRVHRIGQEKTVTVSRFKIAESVEDRIYALQDKKQMLTDGALGVQGLQTMGRRRLGLADLMFLFRDAAEHVQTAAAGNADVQLVNAARQILGFGV
jgi:hypothetical protein